jgi:hypothetical protein
MPSSTSARLAPSRVPSGCTVADQRSTSEGNGPLVAHVVAHLVALDQPALNVRSERPTFEDRFVTLTQQHSS